MQHMRKLRLGRLEAQVAHTLNKHFRAHSVKRESLRTTAIGFFDDVAGLH